MSVETVLNAYQQLSEQEQALFQQMIQRVPTSEEELSSEWKTELDRRILLVENKQTSTTPLEVAFDKLRK
jgi:hypothetical protein